MLDCHAVYKHARQRIHLFMFVLKLGVGGTLNTPCTIYALHQFKSPTNIEKL